MSSDAADTVASTPALSPTSPLDLPIASVSRIVKTAFPGSKSHLDPAHIKVSRDVKAAMARAGGLFVLYLANAANASAQAHSRATVSSDDVIAALEELEFQSLIAPCAAFIKAHRLKVGGGKAVEEDNSKSGGKLGAKAAKSKGKKPAKRKSTSLAGSDKGSPKKKRAE